MQVSTFWWPRWGIHRRCLRDADRCWLRWQSDAPTPGAPSPEDADSVLGERRLRLEEPRITNLPVLEDAPEPAGLPCDVLLLPGARGLVREPEPHVSRAVDAVGGDRIPLPRDDLVPALAEVLRDPTHERGLEPFDCLKALHHHVVCLRGLHDELGALGDE